LSPKNGPLGQRPWPGKDGQNNEKSPLLVTFLPEKLKPKSPLLVTFLPEKLKPKTKKNFFDLQFKAC